MPNEVIHIEDDVLSIEDKMLDIGNSVDKVIVHTRPRHCGPRGPRIRPRGPRIRGHVPVVEVIDVEGLANNVIEVDVIGDEVLEVLELYYIVYEVL